jgi:hypothetical protein
MIGIFSTTPSQKMAQKPLTRWIVPGSASVHSSIRG